MSDDGYRTFIPLRPNGTLRLSAVVSRITGRPRRRVRGTMTGDDGRVHDVDGALTVTSEPLRLKGHGIDVTLQRCLAPIWSIHKPLGLVCTTQDPSGAPTLFDHIAMVLGTDPDANLVGRLDRDTSGVILMTPDGQLDQRLRHPSRHVERVYEATLARPLDPDAAAAATDPARGVVLKDGHRVLAHDLRPLDDSDLRWTVTLTEGRYHEVRRLFAAMGSHVEQLQRVRYGTVAVEGEPGACRLLDDAERRALYALVSLEPSDTWATVTVATIRDDDDDTLDE